jgi:hypothetical protein
LFDLVNSKYLPECYFLIDVWPFVVQELLPPPLSLINIREFKFVSELFQKNGTVRERLEVKRGMEDMKDLGKLVEFKDQKVQTVWDGKECNELRGTDSTIFPPFLTKKDKIESFVPDLCRYVEAAYRRTT